MAARDRVPRITTAEKNGINAELAENTARLNEVLGVLKELQKSRKLDGNGGGSKGLMDSFWRIFATVLGVVVIAVVSLLWSLDKVVAVQTEQIEALGNAVRHNADELKRRPPQYLLDAIARIEAKVDRHIENGR